MNWQTFNNGQTPIESGDIFAIDGGDIMGILNNYDSSTSNGVFTQQVIGGSDITHDIVINGDGTIDSNSHGPLGIITHYSKEGFPQGGVLIRPE